MKFKPVLAAISGNFIEWYDFGLYFFLASILAKGFFPAQAGKLALLGTLSMHAISFFFRPLGAVIFGHVGDVYGRKIALQSSLLILALLSLAMAVLPNYAQAGWLAPILLCLCRIGQGICIGGEFAGSMVYLTESASEGNKSFWASMSNNGSNLGVLFASCTTAACSMWLGTDAFALYGYRLLFLLGGIVALIGFNYRSDLLETAVFANRKKLNTIPLAHLLQFEKKQILQLFLLIGVSAVGSYGLMGSMNIFLQQSSTMSLAKALSYQSIFITISLVLVPLCAYIADKVSAQSMLKWSCVTYVFISLPCFYFYYKYSNPLILMILVLVYSMEQASTPAYISGLFPPEYRYSAVSIAYNCSMAIIGGLSPLLCQIALSNTGQSFSLAYLLTFSSIITIILMPILSNSQNRVLSWSKMQEATN